MPGFPSADFSRFASLPPADRSATVLRAAAELYATGPEHRRDDRAVFEELFLSIYGEAGAEDRRRVAELLAPRADLPPAVAAQIGMDAIEIARLVLATSPALADLDLVRIACHRGAAHRLEIAGRHRLDRSVVSALILDGDPEVAERLLDNPALALDDGEIEGIRRRAGRHPGVASRLARRAGPAAPPAAPGPASALDAFLELDGEARWRALAALGGEAALRQLESRGRHEPLPLVGEVATGLFEAAVAHDAGAMASWIAAALGLDIATARRIVDDAGGEALVVALAALGFDETTAVGVLIHRSAVHDWSYWRIKTLASLWHEVGWRTAQAVVERWRGGSGRPVEAMRQLDQTVRREAPAGAVRRPALRSVETRRA